MFNTDSKIVPGYIHNTTQRFHVYVSNRVARIRKSINPEQWHFISAEHNSADHVSRPMLVAKLRHTKLIFRSNLSQSH